MYYIRVIRECLCRNLVRCEHIQHGDRHPVRMTSRLGTDMTSPVPANEASGIPWTTLSAILTPFWKPCQAALVLKREGWQSATQSFIFHQVQVHSCQNVSFYLDSPYSVCWWFFGPLTLDPE
ncbi:hypothetical protein J6590_045071 [Homalodisca vitripennis]|nr:hypothetical protein J6590_045071 [Homalodisca vitripennis]